MKPITGFLAGRKTYITALAGIVIGIVNLVGLTIPGIPVVDHSAAIQMIITALLGLFIRNGIKQNTELLRGKSPAQPRPVEPK